MPAEVAMLSIRADGTPDEGPEVVRVIDQDAVREADEVQAAQNGAGNANAQEVQSNPTARKAQRAGKTK